MDVQDILTTEWRELWVVERNTNALSVEKISGDKMDLKRFLSDDGGETESSLVEISRGEFNRYRLMDREIDKENNDLVQRFIYSVYDVPDSDIVECDMTLAIEGDTFDTRALIGRLTLGFQSLMSMRNNLINENEFEDIPIVKINEVHIMEERMKTAVKREMGIIVDEIENIVSNSIDIAEKTLEDDAYENKEALTRILCELRQGKVLELCGFSGLIFDDMSELIGNAVYIGEQALKNSSDKTLNKMVSELRQIVITNGQGKLMDLHDGLSLISMV